MALLVAILAVASAVVLSPVAVRVMDRASGYPLAALFAIGAVALAREASAVWNGQALTYSITWARGVFGPTTDVVFSLKADGLSLFFALLALIIGAAVFVYSAAYLPKKDGNLSFYLIMTAFTLSVLLLVTADDVLVLFIGWELVSLASFMLIARSGLSGADGASRTLILTFVGGLTLLAALAIATMAAGTTNLTQILASDVWDQRPGMTVLVALLIAASAFTKAAQFPFHFWLPEAMAAATPVSAFLHAAAVVKAGVYLLLRFSAVFHDVPAWNATLIIVGMFTALISAAFALQKTDLKQLTAYSTVSHLGWIVATIGVGTPAALAAALVHTLAHALFKSSLFMLIGVVDHEAGSRDMTRLGPLWRKMPFTFGSTAIAAASMASIPPLFGFVSKEGMLTAFEEAPAASWLLLALAGVAALLTFSYSAKIIFGAFFDGPRDVSGVHEAPVRLWLPAALPGLLSLPLAFLLPLLDAPVDAAVKAIAPDTHHHSHLALWHGLTIPLLITVIVLVAGVFVAINRRRVWNFFENTTLSPVTGNDALHSITRSAEWSGRKLGWIADSLDPSRHLSGMIALIVVLGGTTLVNSWIAGGVDGVALAPRADGLDNPWDLLPLAIILGSVAGLVLTRTRLTAAILLGGVGVGMSLQMLLLGAPDVALTQFLVESLTVIVIMLVVRHQPKTFFLVGPTRKKISIVLALLSGVVAFAASHALLGRRDRSDLAMWFLDHGKEITGGNNIVAVIIVEFRGFDTLGELSVLGMGAVVLAAMVTTMPRYPFLRGTHPAPFGQSELNALPLRMVFKLVLPVLIVLSVLIFFRGHTAPGGGFVAALVLSTAFGLSYLSQKSDSPVVSRKTPMFLSGVGIIVAISSGFAGLLEGGFLYAIHGHILGQHVTTSLIFDAGIYLAVLGMITEAINALGDYLRPGVSSVDDLNYSRLKSELPDVPDVEYTGDVDEDFPRPINPAENPLGVAADPTSGNHPNPKEDA
ncbi:DUF4040 family protein [Corynebacterium tapiri]|uniref:DUF4040 family protein n=1 Tax=Corynebacterium tapiri TaxID=1448266 RepID=A0A5C4U3M8_9CORY|nr:DUF4040 family protein [Corynebacterium tapiri]TNL97366.1 DUF4040 family protein [Corynebacterium tapiri]